MNEPQEARINEKGEEPVLPDPLGQVKTMVQPCIQCGTCSGSCPNAFAMDLTPRRLWRMVLLDRVEAIFDSKTFALCSACYSCTLRCPRGLPLTDAMAALKQMGVQRERPYLRSGNRFYGSFLESVRRHGRVRETEFMTLYFASMGNPFLPLRFTPLGMRLLRRGKLQLQLPSKGTQKLAPLFRKVREVEEGR
jgi:heterodisulfide reductase subunit C